MEHVQSSHADGWHQDPTAASPLVEVARLDLDPLVRDLRELPRELTDRAAALHGLKNPLDVQGSARLFSANAKRLAPLLGIVLLLVWLVAARGSLLAGLGFQLLIVGTIAGTIVWKLLKRSALRPYATPAQIRAAALHLTNPGLAPSVHDIDTTTSLPSQPDAATAYLASAFQLHRTRRTWRDSCLRINGGTLARLDLELGLYCYRTSGENASTVKLPYLFVAMPPGLAAGSVPQFRICPAGARRGGSGRATDPYGDLGLSAAFDRAWTVEPLGGVPVSRLDVTRVLAPDVQELVMRYGAGTDLVLTVSPAGFLLRSSQLRAVELNGGWDTAEGQAVLGAVLRCLHLVHEMLEQLDPAYKLDRSTRQAVLGRLGLSAPA